VGGNGYHGARSCGGRILDDQENKRWDLVLSFFASVLIVIGGHALLTGQNTGFVLKALALDSPVFFFAFVMLTEPATTPPTRQLRIMYGALNGVLYAPFVNILGFYFSPELALSAANIFSYIVSPKGRLMLSLMKKTNIAQDTYDFDFRVEGTPKFKPGQYMEWTLKHEKQDARGMRRYFTIASSPTEKEIKIGVKFYPKPSSYKKTLESLKPGDLIVASQLAGDFTLPKDTSKKLVFLAGGIGVTPFRSMVKYLLDTGEKRDIAMFYANNSFSDVAYRDMFDLAQKTFGMKMIYTLNETTHVPPDFTYERGLITASMIEEKVPDFKERMFYISGPRSMITSFEKTLKGMGVPHHRIKTDFFPGFA
jgi:ferredoxin-NADP reductase